MRFCGKIRTIIVAVKISGFLLSFFLLTIPLNGQIISSRLVYAFAGIKTVEDTGQTVGDVERRLLSELVRLGASENFSLVTPKNRELLLRDIQVGASPSLRAASPPPPGSLPSARNIIIGELGRTGGSIRLRLEILRTETLATSHAVEKTAPDADTLMREIPGMVYSLFDLPEPPILHQPVPPAFVLAEPPQPVDALRPSSPEPVIRDLEGTWKSDRIFESVRIHADGKAIAHLGGWNLMLLSVSIDGGKIIVDQNEPNSPKLYLNSFPYSLAAQVAEIARPMRWVFWLSQDKKRLQGIEESTNFQVDQGAIVSYDNSHTRNAVWIRLP